MCLEASRPDPQRVLVLDLEVDPLACRQAGHDVGDEPGRHGQGPVDLDLAGNPRGDADLEVRGGEAQPAILGPQEDVRQHWQARPGAHRPAHQGESARQVLLHQGQLHDGCAPAGCLNRGLLYLLTSSSSSWCGYRGIRGPGTLGHARAWALISRRPTWRRGGRASQPRGRPPRLSTGVPGAATDRPRSRGVASRGAPARSPPPAHAPIHRTRAGTTASGVRG